MRFEPIHTDRLTLCHMREDAESLAVRRSDPDAARCQTWSLPFPLERDGEYVAELVEMGGPANERW